MPNIEILFYSPLDLDRFIEFCIKGKEASPGVAAVDEDGRDILGVFSWLHGWLFREAHFFHTPREHPMKLFLALAQRQENDNVERPWFRQIAAPPKIILEPDIPGIDKVLRVDGGLGELESFLPISKLLAAVESDAALDAEFVAQQARVRDTLNQIEGDPDGRQKFLEALRGEKGSNSREVFEELNFSLRG